MIQFILAFFTWVCSFFVRREKLVSNPGTEKKTEDLIEPKPTSKSILETSVYNRRVRKQTDLAKNQQSQKLYIFNFMTPNSNNEVPITSPLQPRVNVAPADFDTTNVNYFTTHYETVNDTTFFEVHDSLLSLSDATKCICTPERTVSGLNNSDFHWGLQVYPCIKNYQNYLKVVVNTDANETDIKAVYRLKIINTPINMIMTDNAAWIKHVDLNNNAIDGTIIISVQGTFTFATTQVTVTPSLPAPPQRIVVPDIVNTEDSFDAVLVVGEKQIHVHRVFLSMISPVFDSQFLKPQETNGYVRILHFDHDTVLNAINYVYGRQTERLQLNEVIEIYRFANEYRMKTVSANMEAWLMLYIDVASFCKAVKSLWHVASPTLKTGFGRLYYQNLEQITLSNEFSELPMATEVIKFAIRYRESVEKANVSTPSMTNGGKAYNQQCSIQ